MPAKDGGARSWQCLHALTPGVLQDPVRSALWVHAIANKQHSMVQRGVAAASVRVHPRLVQLEAGMAGVDEDHQRTAENCCHHFPLVALVDVHCHLGVLKKVTTSMSVNENQ